VKSLLELQLNFYDTSPTRQSANLFKNQFTHKTDNAHDNLKGVYLITLIRFNAILLSIIKSKLTFI